MKTEMFLSFSCDTLVSMTSYIALYPGGVTVSWKRMLQRWKSYLKYN